MEGLNIEAYDADSLRKMVRLLEYENKILKDKLKKAGISYEEVNPFEEKIESAEEYDLDQGNRIVNPPYITEKMAMRFFSMFWGREDVYARRGKNGGYFPQCANRWNDRLCPKQRKEKVLCDECENTKWISLDVKKIIDHLLGTKEDGSDVIGVYPLLPNGTCRFIVFDFDNHEKGAEVTDFANTDNEWHKEVDALRKMCELNGIRPLVERSRSGKGAHVWIFFKKAIPAATARNFGFLLLDKGSTFINLKSFHYYDRMYPSQDVASSIGNLIALPLQGQALKNGNSAFVDENWNAYPDQWDALFNKTRKLGIEDVEQCMAKWQGELAEVRGMLTNIEKNVRPKPWKKKCEFCKSDVVGKLHMVLGNGVYVDTLNLMPRIQNQIRSLAAFDNPEFYKNKRLGYSNYYNFSAVYLGKDIDGYIQIPRGLRENIIQECEKAGISVDVSDQRETGQPIRVSFKGDLRMQQELAAEKLLSHSDGVLSAATAFGKTVVCSYLIAERKVNTLILLQSKDLLNQWVDELNHFLEIREEPPEYETKTGRKKKRNSVIGVLHGNKNTLTGIIDVAMVGSMYSRGKFAAPVSFEGRLEQYVGRLNRDYVGKEAVYVYDYIDSHVRYFDKMYAKRLRTYRKMGFSIWTQELQPKQIINAIFDSVNYTEKFEQDIVESEKMVVISSPDIRQDKIDRFLLLIKKRQEVGVKVTVITTDPEDITYGKSDVCHELIRAMQLVGINVITRTEVEECFAVIDDEIVWHGGMNLLGKADVWDNLMRIRNSQVATELLEIALGYSEEGRKSE